MVGEEEISDVWPLVGPSLWHSPLPKVPSVPFLVQIIHNAISYLNHCSNIKLISSSLIILFGVLSDGLSQLKMALSSVHMPHNKVLVRFHPGY